MILVAPPVPAAGGEFSNLRAVANSHDDFNQNKRTARKVLPGAL